MGKIILVTGPSGVGKTTFVNALSSTGLFSIGLEEHKSRPFQDMFYHDEKFAFPNQIDYLLYRAEQEKILRQSPLPGLIDGGLDLDFWGFSKLFKYRGYLSLAEYRLCKRIYQFFRSTLGEPDLIINLYADKRIVLKRLESRNRINVATKNDTLLLGKYIRDWLKIIPDHKLINLDVSVADPTYDQLVNNLVNLLMERNIVSNSIFETEYIP